MAIVFLGVPLVRLEGTRLCNSPSADTQDMAKSYIQFVATYTDTSLLIKWSDARNCFLAIIILSPMQTTANVLGIIIV